MWHGQPARVYGATNTGGSPVPRLTHRMNYLIRRASSRPESRGDWDGPAWRAADVLDVASFHPTSSNHRPRTRAKLLYDDAGVYLLFHVADQYVKCVETHHQGRVWRDSCVEFFVQPKPGGG